MPRRPRRIGSVIRVYLVEDSPILTKLLTRLIDAEPDIGVVGRADTPTDARDGIVHARPDVVVLDVHLREGTGFDVMRSLRETDTHPVYIVLTNHSGSVYRRAAADAGAQHFFDKSTEIPSMLSLLRSLARDRRPES